MEKGQRNTSERNSTVFRIHTSLALVLPIHWARSHGLVPGDVVHVAIAGDSLLISIRPKAEAITPVATAEPPSGESNPVITPNLISEVNINGTP